MPSLSSVLLHRQVRLLDDPNDFQFLGGGISHSSSPPSAIMLFLSSRSSSACSATTSFKSWASRRRCLTSSWWLHAPCRRPTASCRLRGTPSTNCNRGSQQCLHAGTARQSTPHRASLPARCGFSLPPNRCLRVARRMSLITRSVAGVCGPVFCLIFASFD
jgi:hypothetical protein